MEQSAWMNSGACVWEVKKLLGEVGGGAVMEGLPRVCCDEPAPSHKGPTNTVMLHGFISNPRGYRGLSAPQCNSNAGPPSAHFKKCKASQPYLQHPTPAYFTWLKCSRGASCVWEALQGGSLPPPLPRPVSQQMQVQLTTCSSCLPPASSACRSGTAHPWAAPSAPHQPQPFCNCFVLQAPR